MRIYMGFRVGGMCHVFSWSARAPGKPARLDMRLDLRNHSPAGFEWGYEGSGPAQLALALAAHVLTDDQRALRVYQSLKRQVVSHFERNCWALTRDQICSAIQLIESEHQRREEVPSGQE